MSLGPDIAPTKFSDWDFSSLQSHLLSQGWVTHPLLVVGNDTADEAGVGVAECGHEAAQGLLVELSHCPEHAPARAATRWAIPKAVHLLQPHNALHCGRKNKVRGLFFRGLNSLKSRISLFIRPDTLPMNHLS